MLRVHSGEEVSLMSSRVDKHHLTRRTPTAQYYLVGIDNDVVWCLNGTGSMYTIISSALCRELGLRILKRARRHLFRIVDGHEKQFIGHLEEQIVQLHEGLAIRVADI